MNETNRARRAASGRGRRAPAAEATGEYLALNDWQIAEIRAALWEAERGEFVPQKQARRMIRKWTRAQV